MKITKVVRDEFLDTGDTVRIMYAITFCFEGKKNNPVFPLFFHIRDF